MEAERRDQIVRVLLTATEWVAMDALAQRLGLSHSSMLRMWLLEALAVHAKQRAQETEGQ